MKNKMLPAVFVVCLLLISISFGCLGADTYKIKGKILLEDGTKPFDNAVIYMNLTDITDPNKPVVIKGWILENGASNNYNYSLEYTGRLEPKNIYIISAWVDMDGDEEKNIGDFVSKPIHRLEPNMLEQPFDIYVYPYE